MASVAPHTEIVQVISGCRLIDSRSNEHIYWRRDGCGLVPGYYVTQRPGVAAYEVFNESTEFRGPYRSREDARAAMDELTARMDAREPRASLAHH